MAGKKLSAKSKSTGKKTSVSVERKVPKKDVIKIGGKQYTKVRSDAPLKADELPDDFVGTLVGISQGQYGPILNFKGGVRVFCPTQLQNAIADCVDDFIGKEIVIRYQGMTHNPNTGRDFHDFDIYIE